LVLNSVLEETIGLKLSFNTELQRHFIFKIKLEFKPSYKAILGFNPKYKVIDPM